MPAAVANSEPLRLLLVDDDSDTCEILSKEVFNRGEFQTTVAHNGEEAKGLLQSMPPFDVVVTDLMMPKMSGTDLIRWMRENRYDVPIVVLTANREQLPI